MPGRPLKIKIKNEHFILKTPIQPPFPDGLEFSVFGTGCFWGSEKAFWRLPGVYATAVGYCGGITPNPTYEEVCSGMTDHNESVLVVYDPKTVAYADLLKLFWASHDPTQGLGQGNDRGSQYRSGIYCPLEYQKQLAESSKSAYETRLRSEGKGPITTEIIHPLSIDDFFYAEDYHQQYLAKPGSRQYCSAEPTGIEIPDFSEWAPEELKTDKFRPKIPEGYWIKFGPKPGCTINCPNNQVSLQDI
uniref:peptide-methionine (S)-S-oxide reductase n=1 Tax=Arcella intermedia TaxID=1963864 RepID=A0A6B2LEM8_9EUKA